ncbi:DUF2894 domain-containing protein [Cupriavidus necator]|uniref:DUF2894 domain-containing protein n=1 Tax=Cupriavidus necator TaxID=106590 RepID=UPI00339D6C46
MLDAWRASGADRVDPVRFRFIEALARRAASHDGAARQRLDGRLGELVDAYAKAVESAAVVTSDGSSATQAGKPAAGMLAGLVHYIGTHAHRADGAAAAKATPRLTPAEPELIDYFRNTWTRVSVRQQLRQSQERVPENAGPLNSNHLVHRSLSLMREMSPGYLEHFLSYVDAMSWLEQFNGGTATPEKEAPRAGAARKAVRGKPRK